MTRQTVGIIGTGRLGLSLALALGDAVAWIVGRSEQGRLRAGRLLPGIDMYRDTNEVPAAVEVTVLAVSDLAIADVARRCAEQWPQLAGRTVLHCSGALGRDVLEPCARVGALTPAAHPYQTFAVPSAETFRGIAWGIDALPVEREAVVRFVEQVGGTPFFLPVRTLEHKPLYHASAAVASNYLTTLTFLAAETAEVAGIPPAFLPAIMRTALENSLAAVTEENRIFPLTGPVARADIETITSHLLQLRPHPHLLRAYCRLGITTTELAGRRGVISDREQQRILNVFIRELGDDHDHA